MDRWIRMQVHLLLLVEADAEVPYLPHPSPIPKVGCVIGAMVLHSGWQNECGVHPNWLIPGSMFNG